MEKRKYTFEMWLRDEPFHQLDAPLPEDFPLSMGLTREQVNDYIRNSVGGLIDEGFLFGEDLEKISEEQRWCFNAVLDAYKSRLLNKLNDHRLKVDARNYFQERLALIEQKFDVDGRPGVAQLLQDIRNERTHHQILTGTECQKIREDIEKELLPDPIMKPATSINAKSLVPTSVIPYKQGYALNEYLESYLLHQERLFILREFYEKISKKVIYGKYHQLVDEGKKVNVAFDEVRAWLIDELGYTAKEIKDKHRVTLEYGTFTRSARNNKP